MHKVDHHCAKPSISAVIPAYNRAHCIGRAIASILTQTRPVSEIVIVDDGSTDDLESALKPFSGSIRVTRHQTNQRTAAAARNTGLQEASGDYIAFLDSDDVWRPEKIARQMAFMGNQGLEISCTTFATISAGAETGQIAERPYGEILALSQIVWGCYTCPGTTLIGHRQLLLDLGGFDVNLPRYEDWDLLLRIALTEQKIGYLPDVLSDHYLGANFKPSDAHKSLDRILMKYAQQLAGQANLYRRLKAAVAFNRASVHAAEGNVFGIIAELAKSLYWQPNNWPMWVILKGSLLRRVKYLSF